MKKLRLVLSDNTLQSEVKLVEWAYSYEGDEPVGITFILGASSENRMLSQAAMYEALRLNESGIADLIQNYIWNAGPSNNVFRNTSTVILRAPIGATITAHGPVTPISCFAGECGQ
jgi:hypothetical protein